MNEFNFFLCFSRPKIKEELKELRRRRIYPSYSKICNTAETMRPSWKKKFLGLRKCVFSYPSIAWMRWCCRRCSCYFRSCREYLQELPIIHSTIGVLRKLHPNVVKLITCHTEGMLIEYLMKSTGANCPTVVNVFVCEGLINSKENRYVIIHCLTLKSSL